MPAVLGQTGRVEMCCFLNTAPPAHLARGAAARPGRSCGKGGGMRGCGAAQEDVADSGGPTPPVSSGLEPLRRDPDCCLPPAAVGHRERMWPCTRNSCGLSSKSRSRYFTGSDYTGSEQKLRLCWDDSYFWTTCDYSSADVPCFTVLPVVPLLNVLFLSAFVYFAPFSSKIQSTLGVGPALVVHAACWLTALITPGMEARAWINSGLQFSAILKGEFRTSVRCNSIPFASKVCSLHCWPVSLLRFGGNSCRIKEAASHAKTLGHVCCM